MPMTVITLTKVPPSLRGDLTKWMQEIATGVYIGNFNAKVREQLWDRVVQNVGKGQATISYASRNELGYNCESYNAYRQIIDYEGIPLVQIPLDNSNNVELKSGFSTAAKISKIKSINRNKVKKRKLPDCVFMDLETDGLDFRTNHIIEIGALSLSNGDKKSFNYLINSKCNLPEEIINLTNIDNDMLENKGIDLSSALEKFQSFISNKVLIGYNINFDIEFLNYNLEKHNLKPLMNNYIDLLPLVKKEKMFLPNYKLETALLDYGIDTTVPHRALLDSKLMCKLAMKVNGFSRKLKRKA
ncbi:type I-E CRISPR-associated endoribonuclease Cas2 [Apilactobacillus timberlakei]|uniref:type I-E CRISPR-associated endoribonuclease Cas2e n=1 Tax=Apilactobacillus timberlakei TaxID=2008380 RepID=UPI00112B84A5|nr:type I-E CRISPR-associated endoribonuclease Cas2e [Apilactobacillus timberlakei]TPR23284.1 type I-E CRISPR-associated endoribonuclease Cas2 [Apilactobacillus timberlakei]